MYIGLSKRLIASLIVIEVIVMAIVIWRGAQLLEQSYTQQFEQAIKNESNMLVSSLASGLVQFDQLSLQKQLSHWQIREDIIYIVLFDHQMDVMASIGGIAKGASGREIPEEAAATFAAAIADGSYHLSLPVEQEGERIGTLKLGYRTAHIRQSIKQLQWRNVLVPLLLFIIVALITLVLGRRMTANLRRIEKGVQAFQQGNLDHHIQTSRDGLFGDIADVLNRFARTLQRKIGELNVGNERLQESVEALQYEIDSNSQTEAELRLLQQRMLLQWKQSPMGMIDWSIDARVLDWNPAAERIFGYTKDEMMGRNAMDLIIPSDIKKGILKGVWKNLINNSEGEHSVNENVTKDGKSITCEWYAVPIANESGEVIGVFSLIGDITDKCQQQQMLQRSQKMDALGKLTGGIAHDYNNMLGVVLGYATMLRKMLKEQPKLSGYVEQIQRAGERGAVLSKKLLAFSHNMSSEPQEIDVNSVLRDEQMMLEKSLTARIKLIFTLEKEPWPIWADQSDLVDAILNMSINAMHAMPDGGQLTIQTQNVELNHNVAENMGIERGGYMVISLTDTGTGIDQETQAHIFEPFFTTKGEGGCGLGLSQVYGFMQRVGGTIKIYSDMGHGARFALYFPRYISDESQAKGEDTEEALTTTEVSASRGRGETILIVDDEDGLRTVTAEYLSSLGYQIITAENGKAALELLKSRQVDLVLSDIVMPEMDGYQLAKRINELYPKIKIQLASGYNDERHQSFATSELREQMLQKPFELERLLTRVRQLLDDGGDSAVAELKSEQAYIQWSDEAMTGIGELDDDHSVLFELLNRYQKQASSQSSSTDMSAILDELLDYTTYHFRREESIMVACDYPHLDNHKRVHDMLTKRTARLISEYNHGELEPMKLLDFLRDWLLDHIMTMDKAIALYCKGRDKEIKEAMKS